MSQNFQTGDFLIFQIESGYGLLRLFGIEEREDEKIWYLQAFNELFLDVETADSVLANPSSLTINIPYVGLTNRAFQATQTARMLNIPLTDEEKQVFDEWKNSQTDEPVDRSIRLMLGLR